MYKLADADSTLKSFNKTVRGIATMRDCTLLAPKVVLKVDENQYNYLKYYLRFNSGKITILYGEKEYDVTGWIFVFQIFIGVFTR